MRYFCVFSKKLKHFSGKKCMMAGEGRRGKSEHRSVRLGKGSSASLIAMSE